MPIRVDYHSVDAQTVPAGADIVLYRFLQESSTNVLKHADASVVEVRLGANEDGLTLTPTLGSELLFLSSRWSLAA